MLAALLLLGIMPLAALPLIQNEGVADDTASDDSSRGGDVVDLDPLTLLVGERAANGFVGWRDNARLQRKVPRVRRAPARTLEAFGLETRNDFRLLEIR